MDAEHDAERVRRALQGDPRAFGELVEAYQRVLFNAALRILGDREEARDATQTAFLKAWRKLDTYDPRYRVFSWLYRILMNEALNVLDRRRRQEPLEDSMAQSLRDPAPGPEEAYRRRETEGIVTDALMGLSPGDRQVIVLRHMLHLSLEEIGEALGVPDKTVKSRLFTARQRLGEILRRRGVRSA